MNSQLIKFLNTLQGAQAYWVTSGNGFMNGSFEILEDFEDTFGMLLLHFSSGQKLYMLKELIVDLDQYIKENIVYTTISFEGEGMNSVQIRIPEIATISKEKYIKEKKMEYLDSLPEHDVVDIQEMKKLQIQWEEKFKELISTGYKSME